MALQVAGWLLLLSCKLDTILATLVSTFYADILASPINAKLELHLSSCLFMRFQALFPGLKLSVS